jgi:hypothetical protein
VSEDYRRRLVGVFPAAAHHRRSRLLAALERAYPVRFEARQEGALRDLDAVLELGEGEQAEAAAASGMPGLRLLTPEPAEASRSLAVALATDPQLDRPLHGARLPDERIGGALTLAEWPPEGGTVLAGCEGNPTWVRRGNFQSALLQPRELELTEALRERLCGDRSAALLPLIHFLRELTREEGGQTPPLRASFLFDDPNLHWPTYGYVDLPALAAHSRRLGYRAALATVPLDGWFAHPGALRALRESEGRLSLAVHGNDHYGGELARPQTSGEALALAAQALRRVAAFERRTGVEVDRVMVPPHERCSQATAAALHRCGFEALTVTQPYPWLGDGGRSWLAHPPEAGPLVGWHPAGDVEGLPVLLRHPIAGRSLPEMTLRAFLGQPLILYGHQSDLDRGLDILAEAAADIERLGQTHWCSLGEIATAARQSTPGLEKSANHKVDPDLVPPPRPRPLAIPRRLLSESRDRLSPLLSRVSSKAHERYIRRVGTAIIHPDDRQDQSFALAGNFEQIDADSPPISETPDDDLMGGFGRCR